MEKVILLPRRKKKEKKKASPGLENQKKKEEAMFFFDEEISIRLTKTTPEATKNCSKAMAAVANYKPSRCSKFLTTGGETPRHTWLALLQ